MCGQRCALKPWYPRFRTGAAPFALSALLFLAAGLFARPSAAQAPLSLTGTVSPRQVSTAGSLTYSASASGGDPATTRYAFFRRRPGGTWIPDINAPTWQSGSSYSWSPSASDVGTWETYIWVKDGNTSPSANTYGYAAGYNTQPIDVFGPPTVPGATAVSCAYTAASGDCWVTGDFGISVTASSGGIGSVVYQICRSVDSSGGFAGCDVNLTLTGGTSYAVSGSHLPSDGYRRAYYFQAKDSAGAYSGWNTPNLVRVDRYAPAVSASNASESWFSSRTATVSAGDAGSGVAAVRYNWGSALDANCTGGSSTSSGATLTAPAGDTYLYLCAKDNTGRVGTWSGHYRVSPLGLGGAVNPNRASYLNSFTWTMAASGGTPSSTRYAFFRRRPGGTWYPDVNAPLWQAASSFTWQPAQADVGTWETYVWVKDGDTPSNANTYGYAAGLNTLPIEVVGAPTVPGATTVACAYTSGDDCWVAGDFTASVTASTGGMGSLVYQICRSVDSSGAFAGCDVNLTLTGGTSILVSATHLPADGYRRAYYFQAKDSAGAYSGWNAPRLVRVDRNAPTVAASNASTAWFASRTATVTATDASGGVGANSGVQGVRYSWNTALDAGCTTGTATSSGATLTAPTGDNVLYLCAKDNVGRASTWSGQYRVLAPLGLGGSVSPSRGSYLNPFTWTMTASGGDPASTRFAFFRRRPGGNWLPDVTAPLWQASGSFTWQPQLADVGTWETYVWVKDANTSPTANTYGYSAGLNTLPIEVVGAPTLPGATTVNCASNAGDECWTAGDFTASVTASTGGMGSLVYQICRSVDSTGGFAGCDVNLTLSGGTSIAVAAPHLPSDGYRRAYYFQAKDAAGALSGWNAPRFVRVDRNPPTVSASNASDDWYPSQTATVSAGDLTGGAAANSGLLVVRYKWNVALDASCKSGTLTSVGAALTAPEGDNVLYLCARDNVNRATLWSGRYRVNSVLGLTGSVSPSRGSYLGSFTWTVSATGLDPATTRYAFFRRVPGGTWTPDVNSPTWQAGGSYTWNPGLADVGTWETYVWAKDASTAATANTYGYAIGLNTGPIEVVGPPSVPGPTTVSCAYANGGDCWVSGDFTATVTASSGGMGSLTYPVCRSNDSVGGTATCEVSVTAGGGTSILVSGDQLPGDGSRRAYFFRAKDSAGALSGWNTPAYVRVDRHAPTVEAGNASEEWFPSRTATISAADEAGGAAANSGIAEVRYSWNADLDAGCTVGAVIAPGATLTAPDGDNVLHLCARDKTGRVATWSGRYRVGTPPPDFALALTPAAATVLQGGSAGFEIALTGAEGFTGSADLSVSGFPAGTTHSLTSATLPAGNTAILSVTTSGATAPGTYEIHVAATAGSVTRTATATLTVRAPSAPGEPVIDSMLPEIFDGGGVQTITLFGKNLQGAVISIAEEDPDPDNPTQRVFPTVGLATISTDGKRLDVEVDCSDPRIMDFYALVVDNGVGKAASKAFRVIPLGPAVDLVSPARPERGEDHVYVLSIAGFHLGGTSVRTEPAGRVDVFGVDTNDDSHLNGLLRVRDDAPLGAVDIVVRDAAGREARITIEVTARGTTEAITQRLATRRIDPLTGKALGGPSPTVLFQRFGIRQPEATEITALGMHLRPVDSIEAVQKRSAKSFSFYLYYRYSINLINYGWSHAFVFDPLTNKISDDILKNLGLGDRIRFGAFVLSYHLRVDLTVEVSLTNNGFTWPRFCLSLSVALQIPGLDGYFQQWDYCFGGYYQPFNTGSTSSLEAHGGSCASVEQEGPPIDGMIFATAEQHGCCDQPIEVEGEGIAFNYSPFATAFQVTTPAAGTTTPGQPCTCSVQLSPPCVLKGKDAIYQAQGNPPGGAFQWRVSHGASHASITGSATGDRVTVHGDSTSGAADDVTLEVAYTSGTSTCTQSSRLSVVELQAPPFDFRTSGTADPDDSFYSLAIVGRPKLGPVSFGNPAGTEGFFNNMEIKATIAPCDPALRCVFNFKRVKQGTLAQVAPNGVPVYGSHDCPQGNCDDDQVESDEDKVLDASPGCGIFSIDSPGLYFPQNSSGNCSGLNNYLGISCFNFDEWLEVDGVRANSNFAWHGTTRIKCVGNTWRADSAGAGNTLGPGHVDCSHAAAVPLQTSHLIAEVTAAQAGALDSVARLAAGPVERSQAFLRLRDQARRGEIQGDVRAQVVSGLSDLLRMQAKEGDLEPPPFLAIELLGELHAVEAVPALLLHLLDEYARPYGSDADSATPAAQALARIGTPALGPLLDLAATAGEEEWEAVRRSVELMHAPAALRAAVTARLGEKSEGRKGERLRALLDITGR